MIKIETVPVDSLQPFDLGDGRKNYRNHPAAQIEVLSDSLDELGQYRPIVVSNDWRILAGEGIWRTHLAKGLTDIAVCVQPYPHTDPRARKLLVIDNETPRLAEDDDKALAALLADIQRQEGGLRGTGYDDGALNELLGNLEEHTFDVEAEDHAITKDLVEHKWFVGFVLEQEDKDALGHIIDDEQLSGEKPHQTLTRIIRRKVLNRQ